MSNSIIGSHTSTYLLQRRYALISVTAMNRLLRKHLLKVLQDIPTSSNLPVILKETGQFIIVERNKVSGANKTPYIAYTCMGGIWYFDAKSFYDKRAEWQSLLTNAYSTASSTNTRAFQILQSKLNTEKLTEDLL